MAQSQGHSGAHVAQSEREKDPVERTFFAGFQAVEQVASRFFGQPVESSESLEIQSIKVADVLYQVAFH